MFLFDKKRRYKKSAEYLKPGTEVLHNGEKLTISDSYPSKSKRHKYIYVTTTGVALYWNKFDIVEE